MKDDLWAKRIRCLYATSVLIYLQILMASFLTRRKDLLSRLLETKDVGPMDPKKQKMDEGLEPSNESRPKEKGFEGKAIRLVLTGPEVDANLDVSLGNMLK